MNREMTKKEAEIISRVKEWVEKENRKYVVYIADRAHQVSELDAIIREVMGYEYDWVYRPEMAVYCDSTDKMVQESYCWSMDYKNRDDRLKVEAIRNGMEKAKIIETDGGWFRLYVGGDKEWKVLGAKKTL